MTTVDAPRLSRLTITVVGRPAPQGSKHHGAAGQMREASVYLPAWRAAVKAAAYRAYLAGGVDRAELPLLRGPVGVAVTFRLADDRRVDSAPDLDKLIRSTWDGLTAARVWEDDGRAVEVWAGKRHIRAGELAGADIEVWRVET